MRTRSQSSSLRRKIVSWTFIPTAIILMAVTLVTYYAYQQVTEELVIQRDQEVVRLSARQLAAEFAEYSSLLSAVARNTGIYNGTPEDQQQALRQASNRLAPFDGGTLILDTFGSVVATEPERPEIMGADWSDRVYYREALRIHLHGPERPVFSDIVADGPDGAQVIAVTVPITGERNEFRGVLVGMFRMGATTVSSFYGDIVKLRMGSSANTYLVDGRGRVIYHTNGDRIGMLVAALPSVTEVMAGRVGALRTRDALGEDIVAAYAPVPDTSWGLVTEEYWSVLTEGSENYRQYLLLLLGVGALLPIIVVMVGVRRITAPLTELITAAQEVAQGNFSRTISARTGDEIEELGQQFNQMSAQLRESYATLEQRVTDRTRELAALNDIAAVVSRSLDLDTILNDALEKTLQVIGAEAGGIYLLNEDAGWLDLRASRGIDPDFGRAIDHLQVGEGFSGQVVQTGRPVILDDVTDHPRLTRKVLQEQGFHSVAIVPLATKGRVFGTLAAITRVRRTFTQAEVALLTSIASQVGVAVENARLFSQAEERLRQLETLYYADEELYRSLQLDQVLEALVDVAVDILRADRSAVFVWDPEESEVILRAARGFDQAMVGRAAKGNTQTSLGRVIRERQLIAVEDVLADPEASPLAHSAGIRAMVNVPIVVSGELFGVFNVSYLDPRAFSGDDRRLVLALAQRAALAIENAQLYRRAQELAAVEERQRLARDLHDAVTQTLFSASLIAEVLPRLWERSPEVGRQRLDELRQLTRGALAEMRTLLLELRPSALMEANLGDLLRQLGEATTGRCRVPVSVTVVGQGEISPEVKLGLYRIAQEALNNMAKHSGANQATVRLEVGEGSVSLCIHDDGRGFCVAEAPPDHLGLGIMRERAEAIGAELRIDSAPGQGTQIQVVRQERQAESAS